MTLKLQLEKEAFYKTHTYLPLHMTLSYIKENNSVTVYDFVCNTFINEM